MFNDSLLKIFIYFDICVAPEIFQLIMFAFFCLKNMYYNISCICQCPFSVASAFYMYIFYTNNICQFMFNIIKNGSDLCCRICVANYEIICNCFRNISKI